MEEVTKCVWLDEPILKSEAARCRITREIVSKSQLNGEGQLIALAELLDGTARTVRAEPTLIPRLRELDSDFAGLQSVITVQSPGDIRAVCCEVVTRSWLRKKVQYYGLLIRVTPKGIEIVGRGVRGYRDENSEFVIEADDLVFG